MFKTTIAALAVSCLPTVVSAADLSIEQFAPQSSVLVFSHPGAEAIFKRMIPCGNMRMNSASEL